MAGWFPFTKLQFVRDIYLEICQQLAPIEEHTEENVRIVKVLHNGLYCNFREEIFANIKERKSLTSDINSMHCAIHPSVMKGWE